jgi:two-component system sensor histidine kinase QseC
VKSLRGQLVLRLVISGALLLALAGEALHWRLRAALRAEFDAALRATAESLFAFTEQSEGKVLMELAGETMPQFLEPRGRAVYLLRETDGREVKRSPSLGDAALPLRAGPVARPEYWDDTLPDGRRMRFSGLRFPPHPEDEDPKHVTPGLEALLVVGRDRSLLDRQLGELRALLALIGLGALVALVALVLWNVRAGVAPLDRLGRAVAGVDAASLSTRLPTEELPAELRPIAARLNELLARLESAFERERRFTANAAHELRTPLAELRALAEVNLAAPATETERAESWRDALAATRRMESLSLRLLELSRAENPARVARREPVELDAALREAWRPWSARADRRGVTLRVALPAGLVVASDPVLLAIVLGNLCRNAAEHAPANTAFRITATREGAALILLFRNPAGPLTAQDVPHLFERFWKKDAARADAAHHGLGLSLAGDFAALLGGALTARLREGDIEFALRLPAG